MKKKIDRLGVFGDGSYNAINLINFSSKATEWGVISTDKSWPINLYASYINKQIRLKTNKT